METSYSPILKDPKSASEHNLGEYSGFAVDFSLNSAESELDSNASFNSDISITTELSFSTSVEKMTLKF